MKEYEIKQKKMCTSVTQFVNNSKVYPSLIPMNATIYRQPLEQLQAQVYVNQSPVIKSPVYGIKRTTGWRTYTDYPSTWYCHTPLLHASLQQKNSIPVTFNLAGNEQKNSFVDSMDAEQTTIRMASLTFN